MASRDLDEKLALLLNVDLAAGSEGLAEAVADLPRAELERLLVLAVVEAGESHADVERDFARLTRRLGERGPNGPA